MRRKGKEMSEKYRLKLRQSSSSYISPWKVSSLIDTLASNYYKKYLLNELTASYKEIETNFSNFELVVFNKSFDLYKHYGKLDDFSLKEKENYKDVYFLAKSYIF